MLPVDVIVPVLVSGLTKLNINGLFSVVMWLFHYYVLCWMTAAAVIWLSPCAVKIPGIIWLQLFSRGKKITNESQRKLLIECNVYYVFYHAHALGPRGHGLFFSVLDQYWLQELNFQELLNKLYKKTNNMKSYNLNSTMKTKT